MAIEDFSYASLSNQDSGEDIDYYAIRFKGFFHMYYKHANGNIEKNCWKIHISIDDEQNDENLVRAWHIVANILMEEKIHEFKIIDNRHIPLVTHDQVERGKQITIYSGGFPADRGKNWQYILQRITDEFIVAGIRPSYLPISDNQINGSPYFSYRHELSGRNTFSVPVGKGDPYAEITLTGGEYFSRKEYNGSSVDAGIGSAGISNSTNVDIQNEDVNSHAEPEPSCCGCSCTLL